MCIAARAAAKPVPPQPLPQLPPQCTKCAETERAAKEAKSQLAACERLLATKDKEACTMVAQASKEVAEARASEQREREQRCSDKGVLGKRIETLEAQLRSALAHVPREAELKRTAAEAELKASDADAKRRSAEQSSAAARDELAALRERLASAEAAARSAEVASAQAAEREHVLIAQVDEARAALEALRRECAELPSRAQRAEARANKAEHEREYVQAALEREKAARAAIGSELAEEREQAQASAQTVAKAKETQLAYEGACAEVRRLQTALAAALDGGSEADEAAKQLAVLKTALEERLIALMAENAQLTHQVKHAEHLRSLFQTVTSRTNELQEAANSVIKQVEMSKQTRQGETRPATSSGAGEPLRPANYTLQEIRATAAATFARVPVPPSGPKAPRQGGPDRAALRR